MSRRQNTASTTSTKRVRRKAAAKTVAAPPRKRRTKKQSYSKRNTFGGNVGAGIGAALGGPAGGALGSKLGKGAQEMFRALTGWGDYTLDGNSLMDGGMSPPQILNSIDKGGYIVRHREYLGDVNSTINFNVESYPLNPGVSTFPWLSSIAGSFEEYKFRGIVFEFKSTSSDAVLSSATSSALGSVIMATEYNVLNPNFTGKMAMENHEFANSCKPSCNFYHPIECKANLTPLSQLFVRTTPVGDNADARLYDLGNFQIATTGMQVAGGAIGELWVTYEIELYKPRYNNGSYIYTDHFNLSGVLSNYNLGTDTMNATNSIIKAGGGKWANNGLVENLVPGGIDQNIYRFPAHIQSGKFLFVINYVRTATGSISDPSISTSDHCTTVKLWQADGQFNNFTPNPGPTSSFFATFCCIVEVYGEDSFVAINGINFAQAEANGDLWVTQINPYVNT